MRNTPRMILSICTSSLRGLALLVLIVCLGAGGAQAESDIEQTTMIARVGTDTITVYELVLSAWNQRMLGKERFRSPELLRPLLEDLIYNALLGQESPSIDLSEDWMFRTRDRVQTMLVASQLFQNEQFLSQIRIDSAVVDSYYHANIELFTVPRKQRFVRQITVYKTGLGVPEGYLESLDTLYAGWDPKRKIDSLYERLRMGQEFGVLAVVYSEEPRARSSAGNWGWVSREGVSDTTMLPYIFDAPLYQIQKPLELPFGWVIFQVIGEREAGTTSFDSGTVTVIRERLLNELGRDLAARLVDSISQAASVQLLDDNLALPDTSLELGTHLAIVNERDTVRGSDYFQIKNNSGDSRTPVLPEEKRRRIVNDLAKTLAFAGALREWGYFDRPEVQEARRRIRTQRAKDVIKSKLSVEVRPDSASVKRYYKDHIREFTPERRHFIHYRVFSDADSAAATAKSWEAGEPPQEVQSQWVMADDVPNAIWNRVASVTEGSVIGPVSVKDGHWVVLMERIASPRPLREVYNLIVGRVRDEMLAKRREEWVRQASQRHEIVRRLSLLNKLEVPTRDEANKYWFQELISSKAGEEQ